MININNKKHNSCVRVLEFLKILTDSDINLNNIYEKNEEKFGEIETTETFLKYINTLYISGLKIDKIGKKYRLSKSITTIDISEEELELLYKIYENFENCCIESDREELEQLYRGINKFLSEEKMIKLSEKISDIKARKSKSKIAIKAQKYQEYIELKQKLKIKYKGEEYIVEPRNVEIENGIIFFKIYCPEKAELMKLLTDEIEEIRVLPIMSREANITTTIVFEVYERLATNYRLRENEYIQSFDDKKKVIVNCGEDKKLLLNRLLKYGENCKILKPKTFQEEYKKHSREVMRYKSKEGKEKMKRIAIIPIDNRPVCYVLPREIAEINGRYKVIMPNRKQLGSLKETADTEGLFEWLEEVEGADYIIISADTLIYGGLIPSRRSCIGIEDIDRKLIRLRNILLSKSNSRVLMFSSIMRISNNNINEEEKEYWKDYGEKIYEYSYNIHRAEVEGREDIRERAYKISREIPEDIMIDWLNTRARNFEVNKKYIKMYDDGLIDTLIYSKDDSGEYGLNVKEAKYLEYQSEKRGGVIVKAGADEIPITLMTRCFTEGREIKICPIYTNVESIGKISKYEDISVKKSVETQILTAGCKVTDIEEADIIMYINNFKEEQGELVLGKKLSEYTGEIKKYGKPTFYIDIVNANGGDNNFVREILKGEIDNFYGYSGWNTTGNAIGSGIAAAISKFLSDEKGEESFKKQQTVRLLDDWAYQANIREILKECNIKDKEEIKEIFKPYEEEIEEFLKSKRYEIEYTFPWGRYFEIEVKI